MRTIAIVSVIICLFATQQLLAESAKVDDATSVDLQRADAITRRYIGDFNGKIRVAGAIIDEQGSPVPGVKVNTDICWATGFMLPSKNVVESFISDGTFQIARENCSYISLEFRRDGYHYDGPHTYIWRNPLPMARLENGWQVYDHEVIVLKKIGDVGRIEKHEITLRYDSAKGTDVLDIMSLRQPSKEEKFTGDRPERYLRQVGPPETVPPDSLYIRKVPSKELLPPVMDRSGRRELTPKDAYLELIVDDPTSPAGLLIVSILQQSDPRNNGLSKKTCGRILAPVVAQVYGTKRFPGFDRCEIRTLVS